MPQKTWLVGEEVLAVDFNGYLQQQVVAVFPNAAARTTQWPTPPNGAMSVLTDTNPRTLWTFDGTAWVQIWPRPVYRCSWARTANGVATGAQMDFGAPPTNAWITGATTVNTNSRFTMLKPGRVTLFGDVAGQFIPQMSLAGTPTWAGVAQTPTSYSGGVYRTWYAWTFTLAAGDLVTMFCRNVAAGASNLVSTWWAEFEDVALVNL